MQENLENEKQKFEELSNLILQGFSRAFSMFIFPGKQSYQNLIEAMQKLDSFKLKITSQLESFTQSSSQTSLQYSSLKQEALSLEHDLKQF